jgi:Asp/Glu/hydantoin racemase
MRELMERRGLLDLYDTIIAQQEEIEQERRARARRGQTSVIIIGCAGMASILIMILIVFAIIALKLIG